MGRRSYPIVFYFAPATTISTIVTDPSITIEILKQNVYKDENFTKFAGFINMQSNITNENSKYLLNCVQTFHNTLSNSIITYNVWNVSDTYITHFPIGFKQRFICTINDGYSTWRKLAYYEVLPNNTRRLIIIN